jgi:hypothetical protein
MSFSGRTASILGAALVGLLTSKATAQQQPILLTVNVADPAHVIFTTTGAFPQINDTTRTPFAGIYLMNVLAADYNMSSTTAPLAGTLAANGSIAFEVGINGGIPATTRHVNLFSRPDTAGANTPYSLSTSAPAFVGSSTWNLSGFPAATFQSPGFIGNLLVGDADVSPVLGSYVVIVPEPMSATLLGATILCGRRRRR